LFKQRFHLCAAALFMGKLVSWFHPKLRIPPIGGIMGGLG
jgi:hypothetical protein